MTIEVRPFDAAEYLHDEASQRAFLDEAADSNDPSFIARAIGVILVPREACFTWSGSPASSGRPHKVVRCRWQSNSVHSYSRAEGAPFPSAFRARA